jgi:signal transduction histidine kinase
VNALRLSTKLVFVSGILLIVFFLASAGILYRAQSQQALDEMDLVLKNQSQALSTLVNTTAGGALDFEMNPTFYSQYSAKNQNGFFRFYDLKENRIFKESSNAPSVDCETAAHGANQNINHTLFRVFAYRFSPEMDGGFQPPQNLVLPKLCLVVGIDQTPYRSLVTKTLLSSIPILVGLVILLVAALLILVRRLTHDLSSLTTALETADFGATHEFPTLPRASTFEVNTVVEKLAALHANAALVYQEMWLFLGRASHQLKTPVTAMQATLEVLLRRERTKEELVAGLVDVKAAAAQLGHLTKHLITSSRISYEASSLEQEAFDLRDSLQSQVKSFTAQAEQRGVTLKIESVSDILVRGNSFLLSEIFGNLIENAILYSPREQTSEVFISWHVEGHDVVTVISDQGPGLPRQVIESLFQPFIRGDESLVSGSGLGLSTAKKASQLLGGDIFVQETSSAGSRIAVRLKVAASSFILGSSPKGMV